MNTRMVLRTTGKILLFEAVMLVLPLITSLIYKESTWTYFLASIAIILVVGGFMASTPTKDTRIYAKEGFVIVAISWILVSFFGALPFYLSGEIPSLVDAFFETVSGFTTTGATILSDIEALSYGMLFWRSFTHWIGGMGVLVFVLAFLPKSEGQHMYLMRAEVPGPVVGKLVSTVRKTARILYGIYALLTFIEVILLLLGGMPFFDSLLNSFSTAGTGGFGIKNTSIAYYDSAYADAVITIFMIIFGINFNIFYLIVLGNVKEALKSEELRWYLGIIAVFIIVITINIMPNYKNILEAFRYAAFQVGSIITTTGFVTADFSLWPVLSQVLLVLLMLIGASAGSTGGGIKVGRIIILFKSSFRDLKQLIHHRSVYTVKLDGKNMEEQTVKEAHSYFFLYMIILSISVIILCFDSLDVVSITTAVITCMGNVGPGLGAIVGPVGNFSSLSDLSKLVLSFDMLAGRLEIFPLIMIFGYFKLKKKVKYKEY
jgi:trk system potassium uptake protein